MIRRLIWLVLGLVLGALVTSAAAQDLDISGVRGLSQQIQHIVDAINALSARVSALQLQPGPQGPKGDRGEKGDAGPAGADGAGADPAALAALQTMVSGLGTSVSTLTQEMTAYEAYQIRDGTGRYVGRFVAQPLIDVVWAAARITVLEAPFGATTQTLDGIYEVTPNSLRVVSPTSPLWPVTSKLFTGENCTGDMYLPDNVADSEVAKIIVHDPTGAQPVYAVGPRAEVFIFSRQSGSGPCVTVAGFRDARKLTPTGVTGIVDRANNLNPAYIGPFSVEALYLP